MFITIDSPIGAIYFSFNKNNQLVQISFKAPLIAKAEDININIDGENTNKLPQLRMAVSSYFADSVANLTIPYHLATTPYTKRVLHHLLTIPRGYTKTYAMLAGELQTSPRAIGVACRNNPLPLIFPCHRVVASNGLGGYCGKSALLSIKSQLLALERKK